MPDRLRSDAHSVPFREPHSRDDVIRTSDVNDGERALIDVQIPSEPLDVPLGVRSRKDPAGYFTIERSGDFPRQCAQVGITHAFQSP